MITCRCKLNRMLCIFKTCLFKYALLRWSAWFFFPKNCVACRLSIQFYSKFALCIIFLSIELNACSCKCIAKPCSFCTCLRLSSAVVLISFSFVRIIPACFTPCDLRILGVLIIRAVLDNLWLRCHIRDCNCNLACAWDFGIFFRCRFYCHDAVCRSCWQKSVFIDRSCRAAWFCCNRPRNTFIDRLCRSYCHFHLKRRSGFAYCCHSACRCYLYFFNPRRFCIQYVKRVKLYFISACRCIFLAHRPNFNRMDSVFKRLIFMLFCREYFCLSFLSCRISICCCPYFSVDRDFNFTSVVLCTGEYFDTRSAECKFRCLCSCRVF